MLEKIKNFFKEVITENKKVNWPSRWETLNYTLIVLGISAVTALFLGLLDFVFVRIVGKLLFKF